MVRDLVQISEGQETLVSRFVIGAAMYDSALRGSILGNPLRTEY